MEVFSSYFAANIIIENESLDQIPNLQQPDDQGKKLINACARRSRVWYKLFTNNIHNNAI